MNKSFIKVSTWGRSGIGTFKVKRYDDGDNFGRIKKSIERRTNLCVYSVAPQGYVPDSQEHHYSAALTSKKYVGSVEGEIWFSYSDY